uniref:CCR4-NOT transcription complex subunit 1 CAF1-binding domain-containing protein n=1 Tax=Leptocylindrus danicus TaxID=163516 RepID=A0A7S2K5H5_9STRA|mmetsp:Transcript_17461/g.26006  ORF Transcript_17461/g.26006 Transcript_17461/m.26006 type:complete len:580 (+) Transcript_17461:138-1877(+)|eukprot:CAMPEP_0116013850 /NCGR_PEP_ID=MMETSP0321-20121206/5955_1 /TAXON_ID=163516 /ORGANISM="Leptocylindrus danicus var. danicus, Strain B650" /LENGTH=579 /DNA_ID=CAMNT_0003483445 /DNA_START=124 /DNA_END=1863 /DNA_ORIENTATION=-
MSDVRGLRLKARTAQREAAEAKHEADNLRSELISLREMHTAIETALAQYATNFADAKRSQANMSRLLARAGNERDDAQEQARKAQEEVARLSADQSSLTRLYEDLKAEQETWVSDLEDSIHLLDKCRAEKAEFQSKAAGDRVKSDNRISALERELQKCQAEKSDLQRKAAKDRKEDYDRISALTSELLTSKDLSSKKLDGEQKLASNAINKIGKLSNDVKEKEQQIQCMNSSLRQKDQQLNDLWREIQRLNSKDANIRSENRRIVENLHRENHRLIEQLAHLQLTRVATINPSRQDQRTASTQPDLALRQTGILKDRTNALPNVLPPPGFGALASSRSRKQAASAPLPSPQAAKRVKLMSDVSPPSNVLQDRIRSILNNVSTSNVDEKARELIQYIPNNHMEWFVGYLLQNFVLAQPNNHHVFITLLRKIIKSGATFQLVQTFVEKISNDIVGGLIGSKENASKARQCTDGMKSMGAWYANFSRTANFLTEYCEQLLMVGIRNGNNNLRVLFVGAVLSVVCNKRRGELTSFSGTLSLLKTIHGLPSTNTRLELLIEGAIKNTGREICDISAATEIDECL